MFERFSREARGAVIAAQQVARTTASRTVDTRHVLVALADGVGPAATALRHAGVDVHLKHKTIDGRHLLLGILRADCPGRDALTERGIDVDELRRALDDLDAPGSRSA